MELFSAIEDINEIYTNIAKSFETHNVLVGNLNFGDKIPVIFIQFKDLNGLDNYWKDFNSFITAEYLIKLKNDFSKWNSYIFYITDKTVEKSLKYEIENNKFSTRKIVIEFKNQTLDCKSLRRILSEHIINDDIAFDIKAKNISSFEKDGIIEEALISSSFDELVLIKEENLSEVLNHLEKSLKDEN